MRALLCAAGLLAGAASVPAQDAVWNGAGWYQVQAAGAGVRLLAGPYPTELACKKAMNSASPALACRELSTAPPAR